MKKLSKSWADGSRPNMPAERRYGWCRLYNNFPTHPKWRVAAKMAGVRTGDVVAVALFCITRANQGTPRGSIEGFSVLECASAYDYEIKDVEAILRAFEQLGWIERDYLVTWDKRQPDKEDPTNAARQQRYRERKAAERVMARAEVVNSNAVTSDSVTPRQDKTFQTFDTSSVAARAEHSDGDGAVEKPGDEIAPPEIAAPKGLSKKKDEEIHWRGNSRDFNFIDEAAEVLVERCRLTRLNARGQICRWLAAIDDVPALAQLIVEAERENLTGPNFIGVIDQGALRIAQERERGLPLRFGLTGVKGKTG